MRCHAYVLPSDVYRELEAQILENLGGEREPLLYLLDECDLDVELLSGEWRVLFAAAADEYAQIHDLQQGVARMAIGPDELADALPPDCDLAGVVFVEESDDWLWVERTHELLALRADVYALVAPHLKTLLETGNYAAAARLAGDHAEGVVELTKARWDALLETADARAPELRAVIEGVVSAPRDYTAVREAMTLISNPQEQPSLDAWLRVHADAADYALYFRDLALEEAQFAHESGQAKVGI